MFQLPKFHRLAALCALLLIGFSAVFVACKKEEEEPNTGTTSGTEITVSLMGTVVDNFNAPLAGAVLKVGNSTTTADANGLFVWKM